MQFKCRQKCSNGATNEHVLEEFGDVYLPIWHVRRRPFSKQGDYLAFQLSAGSGNLCVFQSFVPIDLDKRRRVDVMSMFDPDESNIIERNSASKFVKQQSH